jgi:hypothetical protein
VAHNCHPNQWQRREESRISNLRPAQAKGDPVLNRWSLPSVILASQEAEIRRIEV